MFLCSSCCEPIEKVEAHRAFNRHVLHGYRPSTDAYGCVRSLLYLHNESVNVYTHAIYLFIVVGIVPFLIVWPSDTLLWWLVFINLCGQAWCMIGSVVYHLFNSLLQSGAQYWRLLQFDVAGVWLANSLNTFNYAFFSFYCDDSLRNVFIILHILLSTATFLPTIRARTPISRAIVFGLFAVIRVLTTVLRQNYSTVIGQANAAWIYYVLQDTLLFIGAAVNALRYPEKIWPGCFDLICSSHQLFHVFVTGALTFNTIATSIDVASVSQAVCPA